ncbi:X-ray repair cross-complementing protein 6 [Apophysomyces sp. BC1034]|nr:X-ray repair cross-complementing protein 6 [Apophysomyces sp. BC1021]KAG0194578.1 X-ray repair cross-complementing protein 6 [Apophysomyces sp. BC1034]
MFGLKAPKSGSKRLFLITNEDNPHKNNMSLRNSAFQRAKDLSEVDIQIELFGLNKSDHDFDTNLFYQDILALDQKSERNADDERQLDARTPMGSGNSLEELTVKIRNKGSKKRSLFRIPLHVAEGLTIGVRGYTLVQEQKRRPYKYVADIFQQPLEVETVTAWKCSDTDNYLLPTDIKHYYPYGGEKIVFSKDEIKKIRTYIDPGIVLIGFKPRRALRRHYNMSHSYFIYPDEQEYEGSTRTFSALLYAMLKQNQIAICSFVPRANSLPKIVALLPQAEELSDCGVQIVPPGLNVIILPYADDIRDIPAESTPQASEEIIELTKKCINKSTVHGHYNDMAIENPSLRRHYESLHAIVLEKDIGEPVDQTIPDYEEIHERIGGNIRKLKEALDKEAPEELDELESGKYKVGGAASSRAKRSMTEGSVEDHWRDHTLDRCLVSELKSWLSANGQPVTGLKAELAERVCNVLNQRQA